MGRKCTEAPPEAWGHEKWLRAQLLARIEAARATGITVDDLVAATGMCECNVRWKLELLVSLQEVAEIPRPPRGPGAIGETRYVALQIAGGNLLECRP